MLFNEVLCYSFGLRFINYNIQLIFYSKGSLCFQCTVQSKMAFTTNNGLSGGWSCDVFIELLFIRWRVFFNLKIYKECFNVLIFCWWIFRNFFNTVTLTVMHYFNSSVSCVLCWKKLNFHTLRIAIGKTLTPIRKKLLYCWW